MHLPYGVDPWTRGKVLAALATCVLEVSVATDPSSRKRENAKMILQQSCEMHELVLLQSPLGRSSPVIVGWWRWWMSRSNPNNREYDEIGTDTRRRWMCCASSVCISTPRPVIVDG